MYVPKHYSVDDRARIVALVQSNPLAMLITLIDGKMEGNHVPVVFDPERGAHGAVRFHLAGTNPSVKALDGQREAMLVFTGPDAYVSPDWYEQESRVPTWNYAAVHLWGKPVSMGDDELCRQIDDLTSSQETRIPGKPPWTSGKMPEGLYQRMRGAIVGFDMLVERLDAKWKMSQNKRKVDRVGIASALTALGGDQRREVSAIMTSLEFE